MFFPDSLIFYKINDISKEIVESIIEGKSESEIVEKFNIDLNIYNEGTTIPSLRTETLYKLEFNIPSIDDQEKILSYLNPLDSKIQLNNKINNNLAA